LGTEGNTAGERPPDGYVQFHASGERAKGEYECAECGYGVTVVSVLPRCPMCGGEGWEQTAWSPFRRAAERALL